MKRNSPDWISYHIYLPWTGNDFLAVFLPSLITELKDKRQIKRFFFIRYTDEKYHIRLRLQKTSSSEISVIEECLKTAVQNYCSICKLPESLIHIEPSVYSRAEHYFGESIKSVYSELINEQTSFLSMQMLALKNETKQSFFLKAVSTIYCIFVVSSANKNDLCKSLAESCEFAEKNRTGNDSFDSVNENILLQSISKAIERTSVDLAKLNHLRKTSALIKRLKLMTEGRFVATHSIHLYCNKLGFSMSQEAKVYRLLEKFLTIK
jgi:thiopeptide-type bacteriocin biosynthesis protein